ncbi:MAG: SDR family NAD(P)-dependent oxidoreductase [Cyclobacteriaceae bacterium]|nr:SDR family NAD(P)-dependent oxidoreductase [Cyclobacteriaceae bacterium]
MKSNKFYTLITGASQGIGMAFALECAQRGMNLFLVALPDPHLPEVESIIKRKFKVDVITFGIDLTHPDAARKVYEYALDNYIQVNFLINNAGFGTSGLFETSKLDVNSRMIMLNVMAMVGLTRFFIPDLKKNRPSYILNVSSMEATLPLPYKTVYTGTKSFIYSFSLALREEVRNDGIRVSVVCPGSVMTNEEGFKRIQAHGARAKLLVKMPDYIAERTISAVLKGKVEIIPGFIPRALVKLGKGFPTLLKMRILEKIFRVYRDHKTEEIVEEIVSP